MKFRKGAVAMYLHPRGTVSLAVKLVARITDRPDGEWWTARPLFENRTITGRPRCFREG